MTPITVKDNLLREILEQKIEEAFAEYEKQTRGLIKIDFNHWDAQLLIQKRLIHLALKTSRGNIMQASKRIGLNRNTMNHRMKLFGFVRKDFVPY